MMETINQAIIRVWGDRWKSLPIDYKINLRYNYSRTIKNRMRRNHGTTNTK